MGKATMIRPDDPGGRLRDMILGTARADCLRWAISEPDIVSAFAEHAGIDPTKPILMDDETIGRKFVEWFDANIWGELDGDDEGMEG